MTARKDSLYQAALEAPPDRIAEVVGDELYLSPRPSPRHAAAATAIASALHDPWVKSRGGPGGWWILMEPEIHTREEILVPDLAGWRRQRMESLPETSWFEIAPDWVCEVASPSTERLDRAMKMPAYAAAGVSFLWIVDPSSRSLEVFQSAGRSWARLCHSAGDAAVSVPPFEDVPFELRWLWT